MNLQPTSESYKNLPILMVLKLDPFGSEDGGTFAAHPDAIRLLYGDAQYPFHAVFRQTFGKPMGETHNQKGGGQASD